MDPVTVGAIVSGVGMLSDWAGQAWNADSTEETNKKNHQNDQDLMYAQHDLNVADWHMANAYNSPDQQMRRYKQAGLNPNLIYGQMSNSPSVHGNNANNTRMEAPKYDMSSVAEKMTSGVNQYFELQNKQAQTDAIKSQIELNHKEMLLKDQDFAGKGIANATSKFQLEQAIKLQDQAIRKAQLENNAIEQNTWIAGRNEKRSQIRSVADAKQQAITLINSNLDSKLKQQQSENNEVTKTKLGQEVENLKQAQKNAQNDNIIKELDITLKKAGIQPHDPYYMRVLPSLLERWPGQAGKLKFLKEVEKMARARKLGFGGAGGEW